jgi:acetyltransferase-like isoleucine patch superfamily enzyme
MNAYNLLDAMPNRSTLDERPNFHSTSQGRSGALPSKAGRREPLANELDQVTGHWKDGKLPDNVKLGKNTELWGAHIFRQFRSQLSPALTIGNNCTMDGVHFALGTGARVQIGDYCYFTNAMLLSEMEITIGDYVVMGWNVAIGDTDYHPIDPAERIADAIACSPLGEGRPRPEVMRKPVTIGDNVWIGPNATILKGVTVGSGSFIEPGAMVTRDVPPRARVLGNPARVVGEV